MLRVESAEDTFLGLAIDHALRTAAWCRKKNMPEEAGIFRERAKGLKIELDANQKERAIGLLMQIDVGL